MEYRIEKREGFKVIAIKASYGADTENSQQKIQETWAAYAENGTLAKLCAHVDKNNIFGDSLIGISFNNPYQGGFDYAIGAVYTGGSVEDGFTVEEIPAKTWAVFPCRGKMPEAYLELYKKIYTEFFPAGKYQPDEGMFIEAYPDAETNRNDYFCEFWISVQEKP